MRDYRLANDRSLTFTFFQKRQPTQGPRAAEGAGIGSSLRFCFSSDDGVAMSSFDSVLPADQPGPESIAWVREHLGTLLRWGLGRPHFHETFELLKELLRPLEDGGTRLDELVGTAGRRRILTALIGRDFNEEKNWVVAAAGGDYVPMMVDYFTVSPEYITRGIRSLLRVIRSVNTVDAAKFSEHEREKAWDDSSRGLRCLYAFTETPAFGYRPSAERATMRTLLTKLADAAVRVKLEKLHLGLIDEPDVAIRATLRLCLRAIPRTFLVKELRDSDVFDVLFGYNTAARTHRLLPVWGDILNLVDETRFRGWLVEQLEGDPAEWGPLLGGLRKVALTTLRRYRSDSKQGRIKLEARAEAARGAKQFSAAVVLYSAAKVLSTKLLRDIFFEVEAGSDVLSVLYPSDDNRGDDGIQQMLRQMTAESIDACRQYLHLSIAPRIQDSTEASREFGDQEAYGRWTAHIREIFENSKDEELERMALLALCARGALLARDKARGVELFTSRTPEHEALRTLLERT